MKIAVCDDSIRDREFLVSLLREYGKNRDMELEITEYHSGEALLENDTELQTSQIVFLDINMTCVSGLEAAAAIKKLYPKILVVLVTAYMDYVLEGYKVKASRFLVKDDLPITIQECMDALVGEIEQEAWILEFPFVEGKIKLKINDIIYIETAKHKNVFYTQEGSYSIYRKLDEIEGELRDYGFVRAHLSFLINMRYIRKISSYILTLTTGKEISVPKTRYAEVKRKYTLFKGVE